MRRRARRRASCVRAGPQRRVRAATFLEAKESENDMTRTLVFALAAAASLLGPSMAWAQQTIRVGWTIPAEEAKYWMMRRPDQFPDLGKGYKIEWVQFQGTAPMVQAMA